MLNWTTRHQKLRKNGFFSVTIAGGIDRSHFEKVENNHYLVQDQNQLPLVQSKGDDIRKQMIWVGAIGL